MSSHPRKIVVWSSLMLTTLAAACSSLTEPAVPPCFLDELGVIDSGCTPGQTHARVVIQAQGAAK